MRKELVEKGCITNPKDRHKNKNMPELIFTKQSVSIFIMEYRFDNEFIFSHKLTSCC